MIPTDNAPKVVVDSKPFDSSEIDALAADLKPEEEPQAELAFDNTTEEEFEYTPLNIFRHTQMGSLKNGMKYAHFKKKGNSKNVHMLMTITLKDDPKKFFHKGIIAAMTSGCLGKRTKNRTEEEMVQYTPKLKLIFGLCQ